MTIAECEEIAPNLDIFLWEPILADPPLYSLSDLKHWVTLNDVLDAHEALNLRAEANRKAESNMELQRLQRSFNKR